MKQPKEAAFFIDQVGMSGRPEYYSGRGPKTCDLNGSQLAKFHTLIDEHNGKEAAAAFVAMVAALSNASATTFLNNLYLLASRGWKWDIRPDDNQIDVGPDVPGREAIAMASIFEVLSRGSRDTSYEDGAVRGGFLKARGYTNDGKAWRKLKAGESAAVRYMRMDGGYSDYFSG